METRQGKIEAKELKFAKNKAPYAVFTIAGLRYISYDKNIVDNHNPDDFVEITGETNADGFWTLMTMKKIGEPAPGTSSGEIKMEYDSNKDRGFHLSPEEVKCRALECGIEYYRWRNEHKEEILKALDILEAADKFVEWIRNGN